MDGAKAGAADDTELDVVLESDGELHATMPYSQMLPSASSTRSRSAAGGADVNHHQTDVAA